MSAITFDTLKFANKLKAAGVPPEHAEAEAEALAEILEVNLKDLATKEDLRQMEERLTARFDAKISDSKADLIRWVLGVGVLQITLIAALILKLLPS